MSGEGQDEEYLDFPGPAPGTEAVVKGYFLVYYTAYRGIYILHGNDKINRKIIIPPTINGRKLFLCSLFFECFLCDISVI